MPVDAQGKTTLAALLALTDDNAAARPRFARMREIERSPQRVVLELTAPPDLLYFDGHFDVAPILPGVVQVDWAMHYGRTYFALPPRFAGINALKFQQVIGPDQPVLLELTYDTASDSANGTLTFQYHSDAGRHASGRVMLQSGGDPGGEHG
jgi:3-hydroxymyristoyl/3-hydroxydecanoyl-(acyl carrier protein) dehydratase